ncbi:hypothetical protein QC763_403030 [Podospora pseudopauciseta]|uniref:C2H2-type domain-containing protein n=2 Tax=Podospora TaxID=5144 RepID=A0ABR0HC10_9PEZI|nr:hypothetical protein QC763_403030 [Podospora pseudopauciseta]KAK4676754.1 hypothetical protein QC764_403030 [Podospora pseudoanserina]
MDYPSSYLQSPVFDGPAYQDGPWPIPTSASMQRSSSQSTANTNLTYASSQYSTELSSLGSPIVEHKVYSEGWSSYPPQPQDSGPLVANAGGHLHEDNVPAPSDMQMLAPPYLPSELYPVANYYDYDTTDPYDPAYAGVPFDPDNYGQQQLPAQSVQEVDTSYSVSTVSEKQTYPCLSPGCSQKAFSRSADLDRHYKQVHIDEDQRIKYHCDYKKCPRHEAPFGRQDHFRDHLRDFHKEDLLRRSKKEDREWWESRAPRAVFNGWWRCNKCLVVRVDVEMEGYTCPACGSSCESDRMRVREAAAGRG